MKYKILNQTDNRVEQNIERLPYYNEKLVWTAREEFSKDFKNLTENDDLEGFYDGTKLTI